MAHDWCCQPHTGNLSVTEGEDVVRNLLGAVRHPLLDQGVPVGKAYSHSLLLPDFTTPVSLHCYTLSTLSLFHPREVGLAWKM